METDDVEVKNEGNSSTVRFSWRAKPQIVLLVDDCKEGTQAELLTVFLQDSPYQLEVIKGCVEAAHWIKEKRTPSIVLVNIQQVSLCMSLIVEATRRYMDSELPLIFICKQEDIKNTIEDFGQDYLTAPFDKVELLARLNTNIQRAKFQNYLADYFNLEEKVNSVSNMEEKVVMIYDQILGRIRCARSSLYYKNILIKGQRSSIFEDSLALAQSSYGYKGIMDSNVAVNDGHMYFCRTQSSHIYILESVAPISEVDKNWIQHMCRLASQTEKNVKKITQNPTELSNLSWLTRNVKNISYIQADGNYSEVYGGDNDFPVRRMRMTLKDLREYTDEKDLLQIHRSFLINPRRITKFSVSSKVNKNKTVNYRIKIGNKNIPIGAKYLEKFVSKASISIGSQRTPI